MRNCFTFVHPDAVIGEDVTISPFVTIDKDMVIGDRTYIYPNTIIAERFFQLTQLQPTQLQFNSLYNKGTVGGSGDDEGTAASDEAVESGEETEKKMVVDNVKILGEDKPKKSRHVKK